MDEHGKREAKFRELLEKIDPGFRRARLAEELEETKKLAISAIAAARTQTRYRERMERARPDDTALLDGIRRQEDINNTVAEHHASECDIAMKQIAEIDAAGTTPPAPAENGAKPPRAERRRAQREGAKARA